MAIAKLTFCGGLIIKTWFDIGALGKSYSFKRWKIHHPDKLSFLIGCAPLFTFSFLSCTRVKMIFGTGS